ncbi:right-handed parallel beta-helix repeat-containing protein [Blastopirellula sp. JC732]|uniref:Right-handed parallel beta-helix repeat-containing protein n=1 Tax=Blastopirellula sediminis TaxID=2894196 RepID=A0A9X1SJ76_9BACT|nr:right-handed parallel beta-helix repeat-containing protein [Blastopirellula sediminis]MCC9605099.1 right-handed parallel beta-helix repeat-containing protein [Blastopirellula sediminis]MCC9631601.1 right-handed parallel beta-helix repeat-containing protein [Blastopirellula sediminis]
MTRLLSPSALFAAALLFGVWTLLIPARLSADDRETLEALFRDAGAGEVVTIPPGVYRLDGASPIVLKSDLAVVARGAEFRFPESLPGHRGVMFTGTDLRNFSWEGGKFVGHVFDLDRSDNVWEPQANSRPIVISSSKEGQSENLRFANIQSSDVAGAVVTVQGASGVTLEGCRLIRSGKFMWDYGLLWQITVWPEDFSAEQQQMAAKYFPRDLIRTSLTMKQGEDRVWLDNAKPLAVTPTSERGKGCVCFYGDTLPTNLVRGRQYFIVDSQPEFIRIALEPHGEPIKFASDGGAKLKMITDLFRAHLALYAPSGSGPGKGAFDFVHCNDVIVRGCQLSALGDTMHIQYCRNVVFTANQILGSRMGAFFLAEYCQNAVISGNTVDGTNGSRVISVEKSCRDVVITGNTFRNGGRGSWINQPTNFVLANNVFVNNTTKCEPSPQRGRRSFVTGDYETYPELYFTTHEAGGKYGNVIVRDNIFVSGDHAEFAIKCHPGGGQIVIQGNTFSGAAQEIDADGCTNVTIDGNRFVPQK